jgi:hypothetical protein
MISVSPSPPSRNHASDELRLNGNKQRLVQFQKYQQEEKSPLGQLEKACSSF